LAKKTEMLAFANAKVNLGLFITKKRPDGYHNLETVFYPVRLFDVIEITDAPELSCTLEGIEVPGDVANNICLKTYRLLQKDFSLPPQKITLLKNIPVGAGLGGGSSDAAFLIKLINDKFGLGLTIVQMQAYARQLGADCAFFIESKPVFASGIGDVFEPVNVKLENYFLVLVKPPVHVSTAIAYAGIKPKKIAIGLSELIKLPLTDWKANLKNDFESSVFSEFPEISVIKDKLYEAGAVFAIMSGSGSSVFAIFEKRTSLPELEIENQVFYNL
jgi:4-diphosphocytidyl-2-C-methyl-D-erythritol kinase